jgi:uncharacterized protein YbaP (TraB family)
MMTLFKRLFAPLVALIAIASPAAARAPQQGKPALWEVSDADTTIYLFGTIHLLPTGYQWRTAKFNEALSSSQELIVETKVNLQDLTVLQNAKLQLGFARGLPPIEQRVPPGKRPLLRSVIAKTGAPESVYDQMETWLAAIDLLGVRLQQIGLKGEEGPEQILSREFEASRKPIGELESNVEQLGYFDRLPEKAQRLLLEGSIEPPSGLQEDFRPMLAAWSRGDVKKIGVTFNRDLSGSPELTAELLNHRNANWARWIEQRLTKPGTVFVAVGAGHLAGPSSVVSLLQKSGYKVRRVQ